MPPSLSFSLSLSLTERAKKIFIIFLCEKLGPSFRSRRLRNGGQSHPILALRSLIFGCRNRSWQRLISPVDASLWHSCSDSHMDSIGSNGVEPVSSFLVAIYFALGFLAARFFLDKFIFRVSFLLCVSALEQAFFVAFRFTLQFFEFLILVCYGLFLEMSLFAEKIVEEK